MSRTILRGGSEGGSDSDGCVRREGTRVALLVRVQRRVARGARDVGGREPRAARHERGARARASQGRTSELHALRNRETLHVCVWGICKEYRGVFLQIAGCAREAGENWV